MAFKIDNIGNDSTENRSSRYVQGGLTDIYSKRLGWWEKREIPKQNDDTITVVLDFETARPDMISQRLYGKPIYAWLVLMYNNIVDPETELLPGKVITMPSQQRLVLDIISKSTGGNPI